MFNRALGRLGSLRSSALLIVGVALLGFITLHHIGSALPGLSHDEFSTKTQTANIHNIISEPVNGPHQLLAYAAQQTGFFSDGLLRLPSYIFALIFSLCFYYIVRGWFGKTVGLLSALVFCLSPFFLIAARVGSAQIMLFFPLVLMAAYQWFNKTERKSLVWLVLCITGGLAIYVPAMVWWIIGALILGRKKILNSVGQLPQAIVALGLVIFVALLIPAALAIFKDWHVARQLAALPGSWPTPLKLLENTGWMVSSFMVKTPYHDQLLLGHLPLLDMIQVGLLVFGAYAMWTAAKLKAAAFGINIILAIIIAAINGKLEFLFLGLPAIGVLMAAGLRYLYIEWRSVFPRNPIPKSLALILMTVLVAIQLVYGLSYSLIAWPHSPSTKTIYMLK